MPKKMALNYGSGVDSGYIICYNAIAAERRLGYV